MRIFLTAIPLLVLSACSENPEGNWKSWVDDYNRHILKVADTDLECQVTEGEHKSQKFYANIKADTFIRSAYYDLAYNPQDQFVALAEGPIQRETAEPVARRTLDLEKKEANYTNIGNRIMSFGDDRRSFCMDYIALRMKEGGYTASCAYRYDPKDQTIERRAYPRLKPNGELAAQGEDGVPSYDPTNNPTRTVEKAVCRPGKVKLR